MYAFAYTRPASLAEATAYLSEDAAAQAIAGGQTLMPVLRARLAAPSQLIDLSRLGELKGITEIVDGVRIGGGETHAAVAASAIVRNVCPALAELANGIGDPQVRHRGTLGGSIANNDPSACYPAAALALGATIVTDRRRISADAFFVGMFATALEPGEVVVAAEFPNCARANYLKFRNPASRFAMIGIFAARTLSGARIAVTGAGTGVFRWGEAECHFDNGGANDGLRDVALAENLFTGDLHASVQYRINLVRVCTGRAWNAC